MAKKKIDITKHVLVPKHEKVSEKEKAEVLEKFSVLAADMPRIRKKDPAIKHLSCKTGDMIRIDRASPTAGETVFYRVVVNG